MKKCSYCGAEYPDEVTVCALDQTSLDIPPSSTSVPLPGAALFSWRGFPWVAFFSWGSLLFSIFVNVSIAYGCLPYFFWHQNLGPGMMFWYMGLFETAILTFLMGVPCAIVAIWKRHRRIGWLGLIFALTPAPLGVALLKIAMQINGLQFD